MTSVQFYQIIIIVYRFIIIYVFLTTIKTFWTYFCIKIVSLVRLLCIADLVLKQINRLLLKNFGAM